MGHHTVCWIIVKLISISVGNVSKSKVKILIDELRKHAKAGRDLIIDPKNKTDI
jgi:hypothetical protein